MMHSRRLDPILGQVMTPLRRPLAGCFAAVLLLGPAELSAQWLEYSGTIEGRYTANCPEPGGKVAPYTGRVEFKFSGDGQGSIVSDWNFVGRYQGRGKVAADGSASSGHQVYLNTGSNFRWNGQFTRLGDGSIQASGAISPAAGQFGCSGTWSAEKAADPTNRDCAAFDAMIADIRAQRKTERTLNVLSFELNRDRARVSALNKIVTKLTNGRAVDLNDFNVDETGWIAKPEDLSKPLAHYKGVREAQLIVFLDSRRDFENALGIEREVRRLQSEATAAGCRGAVTPAPSRGAVIDELLALDAAGPEKIGVAGVRGRVEVASQDGTLAPLASDARIGLEAGPVTIRTGPGSGVTIQVGSVRKILGPMTTVRVEPTSSGKPDFVETGTVTTEVLKPSAHQIQTPTATATVDGTVFTVSYDTRTQTTGIMVEEGRVTVRPTNPRLSGVTLAPGEYVEVERDAISRVLPAPGAPETAQGNVPGTPGNAQGGDLTGLWLDDTGGGAVYRVRQIGNQFYWIVDGMSKSSYVNMAFGTISGGVMAGQWVDLPGSPTLQNGRLDLRIESNDRMVKLPSSGYYAAQVWTRQGSTIAVTPPRPPGDPNAPPGAEIRVWQYQIASSAEWKGTMTRRGTSDLYDVNLQATFYGQRVSHVDRYTFEGNRVRFQRLQSSEGYLCTGEGTLHPDGHTYVGTANCPGGPSGWSWRITPEGKAFPGW